MTGRQWLIIVGPAAAGKSTFAAHLIARYPQFVHASDLDALKELFALEDGGLPSARYWPAASRSEPGVRRTVSLPEGGHDIIDPTVWDQALMAVVDRYRFHSYVALEFSRGADQRYLSMHDIPLSEAYIPSFRLLHAELASKPHTTLSIVHVSAPFALRCVRNRERQSRGGHYVSESVMRSTYAVDPLDSWLGTDPTWPSIDYFPIDGRHPLDAQCLTLFDRLTASR